jgi:hypothetical protein
MIPAVFFSCLGIELGIVIVQRPLVAYSILMFASLNIFCIFENSARSSAS